MYAIQTGNKFIKPSQEFRSFYDIVVTDTPKFVKSYEDAVKLADQVAKQIDQSIAAFLRNISTEEKTVNKYLSKIPKLEAQLAELQELPYKEVFKKIPKVEKQLKEAQWYKTANSLSSWKRDIARLERIKAGNIRVVKMQQIEA